MDKNNFKQAKGITLIALVITILVLLILAGVSIIMLTGDNGIITNVGKAKEQTTIEGTKEKVKMEVMGSFDQLGKFNMKILKENLINNLNLSNEKILDIEDGSIKISIDNIELIIDKNGEILESIKPGEVATETNAVYISKNKKAIIPKGFKVSAKEGEYNIDNGLVIIGDDGSEFVWIPVNEKLEKIEGTKDEYVEPESFRKIENQIYKYGGFYVGRYEASVINQNDIEHVVTQKGKWPKVSITKSEAKKLSNEYISNQYVQSNLIYGLEWDRILNLLVKQGILNNDDLTNSMKFGNFINSTFQFFGNYKVYENWNMIEEKESNTKNEKLASNIEGNGYLIQTGQTEYSKLYNIYDLAGNVGEWTMEGFRNGINSNIYRGGYCLVNGNNEGIKYRNQGVKDNWKNEMIGFRICLYLK
ncbi:MAG: hypothetical protein ACLTKT_07990 [Clostridia bacterium]|nr:hypothetical protein [Clostridium sp.]